MPARHSPILDPSGQPFVAVAAAGGTRYESLPTWLGSRQWEAGETTRLNQSHWSRSEEKPINDWLVEQLALVRARSIYESRQNGTIAGMSQTLADDVVGPDGPTFQAESSDEAYNEAAEDWWQSWWRSPTTRPNVSGTALLKLWVRNLPRCGEFLARIVTDSAAEGPVKLRIRPTHVRQLAAPAGQAANPRNVLGVEFDSLDRPVRYWIADTPSAYSTVYEPWPPDLVIHEFIIDEELQARGFPWLTASLAAAADLRDCDDQIQDAVRLQADQATLLYTESADAPYWGTPEQTTFERRTIKMAPPTWKPYQMTAAQPPVQYPAYREERQREIGRPLCMPLMILRMDASQHNYSSARFDAQGWSRFCQGVQFWLSGSDRSYGTLNRLVDLVLAEARFLDRRLRRRPADLAYRWTWPVRAHVDPAKERTGQKIGLETQAITLLDVLAAEGVDLESHIAKIKRVRQAFLDNDLPMPAWMEGLTAGQTMDPYMDDPEANAKVQKAQKAAAKT